ncbi:MAG TPA: MFS transporter [Gaiellaceae bacterium]|nr:MFS transporter [Gaiellaceae bacterium]
MAALPDTSLHDKRWTLVAILGATFMLLVDVTIVQVALPSIQKDLQASFTSLQWVIDAYALVLAAFILISGALSDRLGRKRVFVGGVAIFTLASLLCGLATGPVFLDVARGIQGLGGAAMFATSLALIAQEFTGPARGKAIAYWGATVGVGVAVGPLVGGALTEAFGWPWIFLVNLPIGVVVIALAVSKIPNVRDPDAHHTDYGGLVTFAGALGLLVFGLLRGETLGWSSSVILGSFAGAAVLAVAFVLVERRQARPMFDLSLFRQRAFVGVQLGTFAIGAGMFAVLPYLTLYLQNVLGYSPLEGGLRMLPLMAMVFVVPLVTRRTTERLPGGLVLGFALLVSGAGLLLMELVSPTSAWTVLLPGMIVAGLGVGLANPAIAHIALAVVAPQRSGMASGISNTFRIGGLATGVAGLGALLQHGIATKLPNASRGTIDAIAAAGARAPGVSPTVARPAFVHGLELVIAAGGVLVLAGAVAAFVLIGAGNLHPAPAATPAPAPAPTAATPL